MESLHTEPTNNAYCSADTRTILTEQNLSFTPCTMLTFGITVSIITYLSYLTWKGLGRLKAWFLYKITASFEITGSMTPCSGELYAHAVSWLYQNVNIEWPHPGVQSQREREDSGRITTRLNKPPGITSSPHYVQVEGSWIQVSRTRLAKEGVICDNVPYETITFRTWKWNKDILNKILQEIQEKFDVVEPDETKTSFYYAHDGSYWSEIGNGKRKRPLHSVILNENTLRSLVDDIKEFIATEDWYRDHGIPYRRGYLLYGPPGCGKSSFVKAIAGEFKYNICILSLSSSKNMNDDNLNNLMNSTPENSIILLEDIDAAFPSRDTHDAETEEGKRKKHDLRSPEGEASSGKVTLRGLLNALDGVASTEGRIVFLTTNYIDRLDDALTRPGRVDMKLRIDLPNDNQLERMFLWFYPEATDAAKNEFVKLIRGLPKPASMAMVQGLFMIYKKNYTDAIANAITYFDEQFYSLNKSLED